ncbi:MAG: hypothetical protein IJT36_06835 [Alphaproteobacteria bacterium]|nr:hypothetical protein [Alphaproteobacteria bacterium]
MEIEFCKKEAQAMNKKVAFSLFCIFSFFYTLNYLTPMAFGDDYLYSFIWQGHSEFEPLTDEAIRVSSLHDLLSSQWSHYLTWSGRTVSHTIAQFFLWMGKDIFNIFNSFVSVLLIAEIYWCANKGRITFSFELKRLCIVLFMLWFFSPGFSPVFFWFAGACNYLWTAVLLLGLLIPYIKKYYFFEERIFQSNYSGFAVFFLGIVAGWTNENSICWVILILSVFICLNRKRHETENWMIAGLAGLIIGYILLMFAPGNVARLHAEVGQTNSWFNLQHLKRNLEMLFIVFLMQFLLWYFNFRSLFLLHSSAMKSIRLEKERVLVIILCAVSFFMTSIMIFSPNFPPRSSFPGTVQLIIAACILLRIQQEYAIELIKQSAKNFLSVIGIVFFVISTVATFYGFYDYHVQIQDLFSSVQNSAKKRNDIVTVNALIPVSEVIVSLSGQHMLFYEMSDDENDWRNVAFARYYDIKGIRMIKHDSEKQDNQKRE